MSNFFPPSVTLRATNVEIGDKVLLSSLLTTSDLDGNPITKVRFRDNGAINYSGFFVLNGVSRSANVWHEVDATQLTSLYYYAGLIESAESIGVQVFDGQFWSTAVFNTVTTITANKFAPQVTAADSSVLETEIRTVANIISTTDQDGNAIVRYRFIDRATSTNSGNFVLNGVDQAAGTWFNVEAANLDGLRFVGGKFGVQYESIGVQAYDGKFWSPLANFTMTTTPNQFRPVLSILDLSAAVSRVTRLTSAFSWTDQDGNSIKEVRLRDTGTNAGSGFFSVNGVPQAQGDWFTVRYQDLGTVQYHFSDVAEFERYNMQIFDGRFWSEIQNAQISAIPRPVFEIDGPQVVMDTLDEVPLSSLITKLDAGPTYTRYEIIDLTPGPGSADILINGVPALPNVPYVFTRDDLPNVIVRGAATFDNRGFDEISLRVGNAEFWSGPTNFNVYTEHVAERSLLVPSVNPPFPFLRILPEGGGVNRVTFSFVDNGSNMPFYYPIDAAERNGTQPLSGLERQMVREVFAMFETFINVDFEEVAYTAASNDSDIVMGKFPQDGGGGVLAYAYIPNPPTRGSITADIWFDSDDYPGTFGLGLGGEMRATTIHEVGHALGLKHPFDGAPTLPVSIDESKNTVMSYARSDGKEAATITLYDILALQRIYGANTTNNAGDDTYRFDATTTHLHSIWDTAGIDTFNYSALSSSVAIDLRQGRQSDIAGSVHMMIPFGVDIENARAGRNNDLVTGNHLRNLLFGEDGNDRMIGLGGNDVLRGGRGNDTYVFRSGDGNNTVREETLAGRDVIEIRDSTGRLNQLQDDLIFRRIGRDLRIDLSYDRGDSLASLTIVDMEWGGSRVEVLRFIDEKTNQQIGVDIDLNSAFLQSTNLRQRFQVTQFQTQFGFIVSPTT